MDDTFLTFRDPLHVDQFLNYLNSKHPNIRFTKEVEDEGSLSFLDVQVTKNRETGRLETSVYRKKPLLALVPIFSAMSQ